jgi:hypothetical protein
MAHRKLRFFTQRAFVPCKAKPKSGTEKMMAKIFVLIYENVCLESEKIG